MAARTLTPMQHDPYGAMSTPNDAHLSRGYSVSTTATSRPALSMNDFTSTAGNPVEPSPLSQSLNQNHATGKFTEDFDASQRGSSLIDGDGLHRSASRASTLNQSGSVSRSGTLKKKNSLSRKSSLKRSGSRRSLHAGSIKGVAISDDVESLEGHNSVFYTPIPTTGTPTEILANRFQAWRKLLKDLIAYFREVQSSYEQRAKALLKVSNVINNTNAPAVFLIEGGINEANRILRDYHKQAVVESNKARDIETEVIGQLSGLKADLGSKIKEIKSLSGDFKNSVEKEKDGTRKAVAALQEALVAVDVDPAAVSGKGDPYVVRLAVDRQVERQIDEENYLHRAYLNLEGSGRELESIVVGEIQKAYNALATILKRDADEAYSTVDKLRNGPIAMPKDHEWSQFVERDPHFVSPNLPLRRLEDIEYPGKHHPAAAEVRAGMLERKSKYLKSYTPGWYVLSPTHLHEFKSADRIYTQPPVMSLYLPEQKLGAHSQPGSSSHKFILKGRQTGGMHRGHSWVFRAETYDTMMAWYEDIKSLTEKRGEDRNNFVRRHTRSVSASSARSVSDSGLDEDEADEVPYSANNSITSQTEKEPPQQRPSPGGRFPSDIQVERHLQAPLSPSSGSSDVGEHETMTTAIGPHGYGYGTSYPDAGYPQHDAMPSHPSQQSHPPHGQPELVYEPRSQNPQTYTLPAPYPAPTMVNDHQLQTEMQVHQPQPTRPVQPYPASFTQVPPAPSSYNPTAPPPDGPSRHSSKYGEWFAPVAGGAAVGAVGAEESRKQQQAKEEEHTIPLAAPPQPPPKEVLPSQGPAPIPQPAASPNANPSTTGVAKPNAVELPLSNPTSIHTNVTTTTLSSSADGVTPVDEGNDYAFPRVARKNTDFSVSDLHVPGEFPRKSVTSL